MSSPGHDNTYPNSRATTAVWRGNGSSSGDTRRRMSFITADSQGGEASSSSSSSATASGSAPSHPERPPRSYPLVLVPSGGGSGAARGGIDLSSSSAASASYREPIRSFIHAHTTRDMPAPFDSTQSALSVREDTAGLANYILSAKGGYAGGGANFLTKTKSHQRLKPASGPGRMVAAATAAETTSVASPDWEDVEDGERGAAAIMEASEPLSLRGEEDDDDKYHSHRGVTSQGSGAVRPSSSSMIANMLSRPEDGRHHAAAAAKADQVREQNVDDGGYDDDGGDDDDDHRTEDGRGAGHDEEAGFSTEDASLLGARAREDRPSYGTSNETLTNGGPIDLEGQKGPTTARSWLAGGVSTALGNHSGLRGAKPWSVGGGFWQTAIVAPMACLPAVMVGLLMNILDALSYGMILFPLGNPIFANLGSAGISMFYVSTIVSQLTFSAACAFKGGIGSELIEVVPFFHSMANTITATVGDDKPDEVIATTITSYALSSMLTGLVFYLMGKFRFGYLVGFLPRHILLGILGGTGVFLVMTGISVSAGIDGSLDLNMDSLRRLVQADTWPLWALPLVQALILFYAQTRVTSKYFLPTYILSIPAVFYLAASLDSLDTDSLRDRGWIFEGPPTGEPFYYFYSLYKFDQVHWGAIVKSTPAALALVFVALLHVPINITALAANTGEDHADLNHELRLHGVSNFASGCLGSVQNYLVYANSIFFMRSGGNSRLAGFELAVLTGVVMVVGPSLIAFVPVMMVSVLIFDLGFELLLEAMWQPRKKLTLVEYLTTLVIVVTMGAYDFVFGIAVGIVLAFVSLIFQASRVSAVRGIYTGDVVLSTVRRNPTQQDYLHQVGRQTCIIKLAGYLFFGTIVGVEEKIRNMLADDAASEQWPIRFMVLDLWQVTGLDYSAGEAFSTVSRLLARKGIELVISGVQGAGPASLVASLRAVGLRQRQDNENGEVEMLPDLNSALEYCENELLKTFYVSHSALMHQARKTTANLDVPARGARRRSSASHHQQPPPLLLPSPLHESSPLSPRGFLLPAPPPGGDGGIGGGGGPGGSGALGTSPRLNLQREAAQRTLSRVDEATRAWRWQSLREPLRLMLQIFHGGLSERNEDFWFRAVGSFTRLEPAEGEVLFRRGDDAAAPGTGFYLVETGMLRAEYEVPVRGLPRLCESIVAGTTCGELPFFSETPRSATCAVERGPCVLWRMDEAAWERLRREEPDIALELLKISLKLTSERLSTITSYVLSMAG